MNAYCKLRDNLIDLIHSSFEFIGKDFLMENLMKPKPVLVPQYLKRSDYPGLS